MKQGHFAMMFCILFVCCFLFLIAKQKNYDNALGEKKKVENGLTKALDNAARKFEKVIFDTTEKKHQVLEQEFFDSLYIAFGVIDNEEEQERLKLYMPMLALAEEDGIWFYHAEEMVGEGRKELRHVWSEKYLFPVNELMTEAEKKSVVTEVLEKFASEIISNHNYIASQYGVSYRFLAPRFLQNMAGGLEFPMVFVVFQGWPLSTGGVLIYENCVDAGGFLRETEKYAVESPCNLTQTCSYYHKPNCEIFQMREKSQNQIIVTKEEAIMQYGAVPCEICVP